MRGVKGLRGVERLAVCLLLATLLAACSGTGQPATGVPQEEAHPGAKMVRREFTPEEVERMIAGYYASLRVELDQIADSVLQRMEVEYERSEASGEPQVQDILLLSSGGQKGAFAAGFLQGWGSVTGEFARPEFDIVTGVSTGALIAPFAFLGTNESYATIASFYADPHDDWVKKRGGALFSLLPGHISLFNNTGIQERIREGVSDTLVRSIADEASDGRLLLIGATNLDLSTGRVFDLTSEARRATERSDSDRVHRILLASSAIPVVFPPIELDGFYYVDGGVSAQIFLLSTLDHVHGPIPEWRRRHPDRPLPKIRLWNVVSEPFAAQPKILRPRWTAITGQTLSTLMRSSLLTSLRYIEELTVEAREAHGLDVEFRYIAIPANAPEPKTHDLFEKEYMLALEDLGRKMGADPTSWQTLVPDIQWVDQ